ncbi:MAG: hypothetical protein JWO67_2582, partial [Streptosporangiaceae bacterium]|nr:hypothetical protein [Streptosporangiaceae bacterium]
GAPIGREEAIIAAGEAGVVECDVCLAGEGLREG